MRITVACAVPSGKLAGKERYFIQTLKGGKQ